MNVTFPCFRAPGRLPKSALASCRRAFSLIEVVLAMGVVSFAILPLVAVLPIGLATVRDSMDETVTANIAQQVRGELQQLSFGSNSTDPVTISNLSSQTYYYTADGIKTQSSDPEAYYKASFEVGSAVAAGTTYGADNAKAVKVTLKYPASIPDVKQKKIIIPLFAARQPSIK